MFGNKRFGKTRFAAGSPPIGIGIQPDNALITFTGYTPAAHYTFPAALRITTTVAESFYNVANNHAIFTTLMAEAFFSIAPVRARITTNMAEVFATIAPAIARITTVMAEVWEKLPSGDDSSVSIIW